MVSMMIKIIVSVHDDMSESGGTTVRVRRVVRILSTKYEVMVINCSGGNQEKLRDMDDATIITVSGIGQRLLWTKSPLIKALSVTLWNLRLLFTLLRTRPAIVYCANDWFGFPGVYLASRILKCKIIYEAQSIYFEESKELGHSGIGLRLRQALESFLIRHSHHIIALSQNTYEFYSAYNHNIDLIPVFVDDEIFKKRISKPAIGDTKLVGLIGPFDSAFNEYFLDYVDNNIERFDRRIRFLAIGRCGRMVRSDRIAYTGYLNSVADYIGHLSCLDAVLIPSRVATSGPLNKIIETMSCSLPVFTTPKGIVGLYSIEPGRDILVFDEKDLVERVNELIFDDRFMADIGRNAREAIERYYSKSVNENKLMGILESVSNREEQILK